MLRYSWLLACAAALTPQLANAQTQSNNIDRAAAAREAGDYRTAATLLEVELRDRPLDPLVLRLLGAAYAYGGEYEKAITVLKQARAVAPTDQDVALMLARTYLWAGRNDDAAATASAVALADPANLELREVQVAIAKASAEKTEGAPQLLASFTQALSSVAIGRGNKSWHQSIFGLAVPIADGATLSGMVDRESRAGPIDTRIELRTDISFGNGDHAYAAASVTPKADFREQWGVRVGGEASVARALSITVDLRYADYGSTEIVAIEPGLRLHAADDHLSLAVKSINLWTEDNKRRNGWSARGELQAKKSVRFVAGGATYPDTEAGITRRTRAAFFGTICNLSDRATLRTFYEYERRAQSYTRNGVVLALSIRF